MKYGGIQKYCSEVFQNVSVHVVHGNVSLGGHVTNVYHPISPIAFIALGVSVTVATHRLWISLRYILMVLAVWGGFCALTAEPAVAADGGVQWTVTNVSEPTNFTPAGGVNDGDLYRVEITNTGTEASDGEPITITDQLPEAVEADTGASGIDQIVAVTSSSPPGSKFTCVFSSCTFTGTVVPDNTLIVTFPVTVKTSSEEQVTNVVRVAGGGAPDASMSTLTTISSHGASFGISSGSATTALSSTQAGAHPDITSSLAFNTVGTGEHLSLADDPKDITAEEPPGFVADFLNTPACLAAQFARSECPIESQVGVTTITLQDQDGQKEIRTEAVYNLSPNPGEVAKFGFSVVDFFDIQGDVTVRPGDYGATVAFHDTDDSIAEVFGASLTVWGVPAAAIHDTWRWTPEGTPPQGKFGTPSKVAPYPYFTNPTSCDEQLDARFQATSWEGGPPANAETEFGPIVGCDRLSFPASFTAEPTTEHADAPSGLNVGLTVKQTYENAEGLATSALNKAVVTLPEGMTVNPSAGSGLGACSLAEYAEEALEVSSSRGCPNDSKMGTVSVETPVLSERGEGSVFLAEPAPNGETGRNPFNSLIALYVVVRFPERGIVAKIAGYVAPNPVTGQLVATFEHQPELEGVPGLEGLPPVPFNTFTFRFHQGTTSPLVTPPVCGSYAASVALDPWSDPAEVLVPELRPFNITQGFEGGLCPVGVPPFDPQVLAGTLDDSAGSYSPLYLRVIRNDGEQEITRFSAVLPPGLTANLSGVPFCSDADIELARQKTGAQEETEPACPPASEIGHTLVGAGVGSVLAWAPGKVYMAGPYNGAPFSIVAITSAKVGPFDLGTVVVREALEINPETAVVTVDAKASDPIPHIIKGIVVHVRDIRVYIDRPGYTLNPTSCEKLTFASTIDGAGADPSNSADQAPVTIVDPFQASNCQNLKFKPGFKVSTSGKTSRANGASLTAKLTYPKAAQGTQANIRSVKVDLPKQLPSRLSTLQKACVDRVFEANPAACPVASRVGAATAITPILPVPLAGPAYFVSHGGAKFPELIIVLEGYGVRIDLRGETYISKAGITSSTFHTVPDQPVSSFELTLPQGHNSALAANGNLCKKKLEMPTAFTAQNGMVIHESTPITVTGCLKIKTKKAKKAGHTGGHGNGAQNKKK